MLQEQINQAVNEISNLQEIPAADLKLLTERYPYCQVAQVIYAKKLHSTNHPAFEKQLQKTSAIVFDRNILFEIIENTPLRSAVAAGFEQEEEIKQKADIESVEDNLPVIEDLKKEIADHELQHDEPVMIHENISEEVFDQIISDQKAEEAEIKTEEIIIEQPVVENAFKENEIIEPPIPENDLKEDTIIPEEIKLPVDEIADQEKIESNMPDEQVIELKEMIQSEEPIREDEPVAEELIEKEPETEEPLFEMPGYNIERELGTLDEKDEIRIEIQKPVTGGEIIEEPEIQEVSFESQQHSFAGWFQTMGLQNRAKVIELKAEHKPVKQITASTENAPVSSGKETVKPVQSDLVTEQIAGELAKKSLQFDDRLASETYARILYMQGKYARAIEMYEKLSLLKPAKSDYFAALIEQIKKRK